MRGNRAPKRPVTTRAALAISVVSIVAFPLGLLLNPLPFIIIVGGARLYWGDAYPLNISGLLFFLIPGFLVSFLYWRFWLQHVKHVLATQHTLAEAAYGELRFRTLTAYLMLHTMFAWLATDQFVRYLDLFTFPPHGPLEMSWIMIFASSCSSAASFAWFAGTLVSRVARNRAPSILFKNRSYAYFLLIITIVISMSAANVVVAEKNQVPLRFRRVKIHEKPEPLRPTSVVDNILNVPENWHFTTRGSEHLYINPANSNAIFVIPQSGNSDPPIDVLIEWLEFNHQRFSPSFVSTSTIETANYEGARVLLTCCETKSGITMAAAAIKARWDYYIIWIWEPGASDVSVQRAETRLDAALTMLEVKQRE